MNPLPPFRSGAVAIVLAALGLGFGGCEQKKPPVPDEFPKPTGGAAAPASTNPDAPREDTPDETGYALFLRARFPLSADFAKRYPQAASVAADQLKQDVFKKNPPRSVMQLQLTDDKRILAAQFGGRGALQDHARVERFLAEGQYWSPPPVEAPPTPAPDPQAEALKMKIAGLTQALLQLDNPGLREKALEEIATDLARPDPKAQLAALQALGAAGQVDFDRSRFRPLVLPLLASVDGEVRAAAVGILLMVDPAPDQDLPVVLAMVDDEEPGVREALPYVIKQLTKGDLTGAAGQAEIRLLERTPPDRHRSLLSSLWGSRYSPELEDKLISMANAGSERTAYDVMYYSLSTQLNKGEKTVNLLLSCLEHRDVANVAGRALWGLAYGVNPDQQSRVADAALKYMNARVYGRDECLRILKAYGSANHAEALVTYAGKEGVPPEFRQQASAAADAILNRKP